MRTFAVLGTLLVAMAARADVTPITDRFRVDASVGGVVRRDLRELGKAALQYVPLEAGRFRLRGAADVEHREKKKRYRFQLDMTVQITGHRLNVLENRNRFDGDAAEIRERVERIVPFLYLARMLPVPSPAEEPARTWLARHGFFVMRYVRRETTVEASLYQDDALVARFELEPRGPAPPHLDRVAIPASEQVMVRFNRVR